MANNKMLIDASHPEETRVLVARGNRIEEFDFEAQERRQLRGNIYLAKVTRVEPSLQAAFIDYGGNRHGFLAFSEIHPDYYQIPAADRQALLAAEEEAATAEEDEGALTEIPEPPDMPDGDPDASDNGEGEDGEEDDRPVRRARRRTKRGSGKRKSARRAGEAEDGDPAAAESDASAAEAAEDNDTEDTETASRTMSAAIETDSISEPAPAEDGAEDGAEDDEAGDGEDVATAEAEAEPAEKKPKKTRRRKSATTKKAPRKAKAAKSGADEATEPSDEAGETPAEADTAENPADDAVSGEEPVSKADAGAADGPSDDEAEADTAGGNKPKRGKSARGRGKAKAPRKKTGRKEQSTGDDEDGNGGSVESVGQEDALDEVLQRSRPRRQYKIQEVIRRRQIMLVQVVKEERGNKGAALTTYLSLAGRYSVLMPNTARGGGISRKITAPADRKRLKEIAGQLEVPKGMGVILRTAGASRTAQEIRRDFEYLMRLWENVRNLTLESSAPFLVYEEGSLIKRSIRDLYNKEIGEIVVAGEEGYREAKSFMRMLMPSHAKNVKLYDGEQPLFSKFGVETQLDKMLAPQVTLKSGGYLVINQTEALVAIDVNSGRSTREHSIEATALQTNLEAAEEVARQLRLRDLAGLVVIDFIDMEEKRNNRTVERKLKECLKIDRARIQVGHISHFGLLEMSRQRIRASVLESTMEVCPHCQGVGHVRSQSSLGIHILRAVEDHLNRNAKFDVIVRATPDAALYLLNSKRQAIGDLELRAGVKIIFEADQTLEGQNFVIERGDAASGERHTAKAINPMVTESYESEESSPEPVASEGGETDDREASGDGQRKRRRRRGGRGRGRDGEGRGDDRQALAEPTINDTAEAAEAAKSSAASADNGADAPSEADRPRRRGATRSAARSDRTAAAENTHEENTQETGGERDAAAAESEPQRPRRRTGRPGKKAREGDAPMAEAQPVNDAEASSSAAATDANDGRGSPPRPVKRRNTRRVSRREKTAETDGEAAAESTARPIEPEPGEATSASEESAASTHVPEDAAETDDKPKKKRGWGFFS